MALSANIKTRVAGTQVGTPDLGTASFSFNELFETALTNGTGANQANNVFVDKFTITGAGTQTYDLAGGVSSPLGGVLTFTAIKAIILKNTGAAPLTYGGGSSPFLGFLGDASDEIIIPAGGLLVLTDPTAAGQTVTASTGDLITIGATDGAGTIIIIGEA